MPKVRVRNNHLQLDGEPTYEPFEEVEMTEEKASMYVSMGLADLMREETVVQAPSRVSEEQEGTNTLSDAPSAPADPHAVEVNDIGAPVKVVDTVDAGEEDEPEHDEE